MHSDDPSGSQRLNQEAAKAMAAGAEIGIPDHVTSEAIKWITINPAWALGLDDRIGSLEAGKNADVVLWSGNPFSVYSQPEKVWIDGALLLRSTRSAAAVAHRFRAWLRAAQPELIDELILAQFSSGRRRRSDGDAGNAGALRRPSPSPAARSIRCAVRPIENGTVVITDGRITAVGANVAIPAGAQRIDATGKMGDARASSIRRPSSACQEVSAVNDTRDMSARGKDNIAAAFPVWEGLNPDSVLLAPARKEGITSVVVIPTGGLVAGQAALLDLVAGHDDGHDRPRAGRDGRRSR